MKFDILCLFLGGRRTPPEIALSGFEHVFDVTPSPLLLADSSGIVLRANVAAGELLQRNPDDLRGALIAELLSSTNDLHGQRISFSRREVPESKERMHLYALSQSPSTPTDSVAADSKVDLVAVTRALHDFIGIVKVVAPGEYVIESFNDSYMRANERHGITIDANVSFGQEVRAFLREVLKMGDDQIRLAESRLKAVVESAKPIRFEDEFSFPDGAIVTTDATLSPILSEDGRVDRLLYFSRDITEQKRTEAALRASELRWQFALEGARDGLWDWDVATGITYFSLRWKEMLGYADEELENHFDSWRSRIHPDDLEATLAAVQGYLAGTCSHYAVEHRLRCKDGTYKWILARGQALERDADSRPLRILGTHTDITESKEAIHALRETEGRFRVLIEDLDVGVVLQDPADRVLLSNAAAQRILGLDKAALEGVTSRDPRWRLVRLDGSPLPMEEVPSVIAARTLQPVKNITIGSSNIDTGERRWLEVSASPRLDSKGGVLHTLVTLIDVTSEYKASAALRESESKLRRLNERFQLAAEAASIGIWACHIADQTLEWDESMHRIFCVAPDEFEDCFAAFRARVHPDDIPRVDRLGLEAMGNLAPYKADFRLVWPNQTIRHIQSFGRIVGNEQGEPDYMVGVCYDVTSQRELEAQLLQAQKMQAIGQLAGGIAHDFNNLLTIVNGYCESILQDTENLKDSLRRQIEAIDRAGERAAILTQKLLVFSRKEPLRKEAVSLNRVLSETGSMLLRLIEESIVIEVEAPESDLYVESDRAHIDQLLMNLALNARDAMPDGGVLRIELEQVVFDTDNPCPNSNYREGRYARLCVQDTGTGIPKAIQGRLFEPFFTTKGVGRGTGLGLATVYGVVESAGGFVTIDSEPGSGARFNVYLPECDAPVDGKTAMAESCANLRGTETILLVEDEQDVRRVTRLGLEANGYTVIEALSPLDAIQRFREGNSPIDMLLTDIVMPGMNGRQLAAALWMERPGLKVLFMSGYDNAGPSLPDRASKAFVAKPFRMWELLAKVREVLDQ